MKVKEITINNTGLNFIQLVHIISTLRKPEGCPWDKKQTPESIKKYLLEETHELLEAIDQSNHENICEELGDLLFQVIMVTTMFAEKGLFNIDQVIADISQKMIRRHPHVFGDEKDLSEDEIRANWQRIKKKEKQGNQQNSCLYLSLPKTLPALQKAQRVSEKAARAGFEWPNVNQAFEKVKEEIQELEKALEHGDKASIAEEIGDSLLALVNVARIANVNAEETMNNASLKFSKRFSVVSEYSIKHDIKIDEMTVGELLEIWNGVKEE